MYTQKNDKKNDMNCCKSFAYVCLQNRGVSPQVHHGKTYLLAPLRKRFLLCLYPSCPSTQIEQKHPHKQGKTLSDIAILAKYTQFLCAYSLKLIL